MRLVVDTNVVFSALIADGATRTLLLGEDWDLYVPEYFFAELRNNRPAVREKTGLSDDELTTLLNLLFGEMTAVPREEFVAELPAARDYMHGVDPDDAPFLALAMAEDAAVWSDDEHFQEQDAVAVWQTHELLER